MLPRHSQILATMSQEADGPLLLVLGIMEESKTRIATATMWKKAVMLNPQGDILQ